MKRKSLWILSSIGVLCCACQGAEVEKVCTPYQDGMEIQKTTKQTPKSYASLTYDVMAHDGENADEVMPIGGFYCPYSSGGSIDGHQLPDFLTDKVFQQLEDCGINMFVYSIDTWDSNGGNNKAVELSLELAEKHHIGEFVNSGYIQAQLGGHTTPVAVSDMDVKVGEKNQTLIDLVDTISKNGTRKSFLGFHAMDEAFENQLPSIGAFSQCFNDLPNRGDYDLFYNVLGSWEGEFNFYGYGSPMTYEDYVKQFFANSHAKMLSATQDPFTSAETPENQLTTLLFNQLALYRKVANDYSVPQWRMLQAGGQWNDEQNWIPSVDPYPSEGELLFDVNMSLAYGAKAIQYFPLIQPLYFAYKTGHTYDFENRCGLIGADGNLTRWYYYAKRANTQIRAIDHVLMKSASEGILVHGKTANEYIVEKGNPQDSVLPGSSYRELQNIEGDDCVVGCFDYQGGSAFYVVNYQRDKKAEVNLTFDSSKYAYTVTQRGVSSKVVGNYVPLRLDAGEAALIVLD